MTPVQKEQIRVEIYREYMHRKLARSKGQDIAAAQVEIIKQENQPTNWNDIDPEMRKILFVSKIFPNHKHSLRPDIRELISIELCCLNEV